MIFTRFIGKAPFRRPALAGLCALAAVAMISCGETNGQLSGRMYVPSGLQGRAQWGEAWLVRNYSQLRDQLSEHERLLVLSLLSKDAAFMRKERENILALSEIQARLKALDEGKIPTRIIPTENITISSVVGIDSLLSSVRVRTRQPTAAEQASISSLKRALQDSAIIIRGRMQSSVNDLMRQRADQKSLLMADADALVESHRFLSTPVHMDGEYRFENVPLGDYGIYGRYVLMKWYVLSPATVTKGILKVDVPRLPGLVTESKAVTGLDAAVAQIERM